MNLKRYSEVCATLERRGYGPYALSVFNEMLCVDKAINGRFRIERTITRDGLVPMTVTYDSASGWSCRTNWLESVSPQERVSSL